MKMRFIAVLELALIVPAAFFLSAALVAMGHNPQFELGNVAQRIVEWYAARMWTLWLLLLVLPFAAVATGCATLLGAWKSHRAAAAPSSQLASVFVGSVTLTSAGVLAIVILHVLAN